VNTLDVTITYRDGSEVNFVLTTDARYISAQQFERIAQILHPNTVYGSPVERVNVEACK